MMTNVWGPPGWVFLHCITIGYPIKIDPKNKEHISRKKHTMNFFNSLGHVLPCKYCRESYLTKPFSSCDLRSILLSSTSYSSGNIMRAPTIIGPSL